MRVTYAMLQDKCDELGVNFEVDEGAVCYRATCNDGYRWEEGLHEFIAVWEPFWTGDRAKAREDLFERLDGEAQEVCDETGCDWCESTAKQEKETT